MVMLNNMQFDQETIKQLAKAVARELAPLLAGKQSTSDDMKYLASLTPAERKQKLKERREHA